MRTASSSSARSRRTPLGAGIARSSAELSLIPVHAPVQLDIRQAGVVHERRKSGAVFLRTEATWRVQDPTVTDYGDLVQMTAQVGGGFSDVPQGAPIGTSCSAQNAPSCFS